MMLEDNQIKNKKEIMAVIGQIVTKERLKQREIADLFDIKQPRVSDLIGGKYERFSLDILLVYLSKLGYEISFANIDTQRGKPLKVAVNKVHTDFVSIL